MGVHRLPSFVDRCWSLMIVDDCWSFWLLIVVGVKKQKRCVTKMGIRPKTKKCGPNTQNRAQQQQHQPSSSSTIIIIRRVFVTPWPLEQHFCFMLPFAAAVSSCHFIDAAASAAVRRRRRRLLLYFSSSRQNLHCRFCCCRLLLLVFVVGHFVGRGRRERESTISLSYISVKMFGPLSVCSCSISLLLLLYYFLASRHTDTPLETNKKKGHMYVSMVHNVKGMVLKPLSLLKLTYSYLRIVLN